MSRTAAATNGKLWVWSDNDNPGAGTKGITKTAGGTGLNANWESLDAGVFTEHNENGTHKDDKITGANIKNTIVDGVTLEATATTGTKTFRIKDAGVSMAKIAQASATTGQAITWNGSAWAPGTPVASLADAYVTRAKLADVVKPVTSYLIASVGGIADGTLNGAVPAVLSFSTNQTAGVVVMERYIRPRQENRYVRVLGNAFTNNASRAWTVELLVNDVVVATTSGTNTSENLATPEVQLGYLIQDGTAYATPLPLKIGVKLKCVNPGVGTLDFLTVTLEATNANN